MPNIEQIGSYFLRNNIRLTKLDLSKVKNIGSFCLEQNRVLEKIILPLHYVDDIAFISFISKSFISKQKKLIKCKIEYSVQ